MELILTGLFLAVSVSIDTLASGFAYGASNIRIPFSHLTVINVICSIFFGISLLLGYAIGQLISPSVTIIISVSVLILIGCLKILQYFRKRSHNQKPVHRQISWPETIALSIALSIDSIAAGVGVSIYNATILFCLTTVAFALVIGIVLFMLGHFIGSKVAPKNTALDLSYLSGIVLIAIAIGKIFI